MKLHNLALGLALAVAGSAFAATTHETTVTRVTPHGTVTKHIVRTNERHHPAKRVVVVNNHHRHHAVKKVVIVQPQHRHATRHATVTRHVVIRREG